MKIKKIILATLALILSLSITACSSNENNKETDGKKTDTKSITLKIGASPTPHAEILEYVKPLLLEKGVNLQIEIFTDYNLPNKAVDNGDLDANYFQHEPYMINFNEKNKTSLVNVGKIHFEPLGIYAGKTKNLESLQDGALIGVPNDSTNEARALLLLEKNGLIKLKKDVGLEATVNDIVENTHKYKIEEIEAAQLPRSLQDLDVAVINGNYALTAQLTDKVLTTEDPKSENSQQFANLVAVKKGNENSESIKILMEVLKSEKTKTFLNEKYGVTVMPAF